MTECTRMGRVLVGTMYGFSGTGTGHTQRIACRKAYEAAGIHEASTILLKNAMSWDCEGNCETRTGLSVTPEPVVERDPISGLWSAELDDATLKVWVECFERADRQFEKRAPRRAAAFPFDAPASG